jgi:hypothetical protein
MTYNSREFFLPSLRPHEDCGISDGFARHTVTSLFDDFSADAAIETVNVFFWAIAPGQVLWKYKIQ